MYEIAYRHRSQLNIPTSHPNVLNSLHLLYTLEGLDTFVIPSIRWGEDMTRPLPPLG